MTTHIEKVVVKPFTFQVKYEFSRGSPATRIDPPDPPEVELLAIWHGEAEILSDLADRWPRVCAQIEEILYARHFEDGDF